MTTLYFEPRHGVRHVVVVGLGGTGSYLARSVARIVYDMRARRMHPPTLTFIDPDTVENKNVGRQMFLPADVGQHKALLLARRFNAALGLDIAAIPEPYDPDRHPSGRNVLLIGCVDNHIGRRAMARSEGSLWLDNGNHAGTGFDASGQVICGTTSDPDAVRRALTQAPDRGGEVTALPNAALVFPSLLEPEDTPAPSCGENLDAGTQHLLINDAVATTAATYVYQLLHRQPLTHWMSYVGLGAVRPVPVSAESMEPYT